MNRIKNIIFDFDGVILNSVKLKDKAFLQTLVTYSKDIKKKFMNFHLNNLGVSRYQKYRFLCHDLLKLKKTKILEKKLADDYSKKVSAQIKKAKFIKGIKKFIKKNKEKNLFISSGTPEKELNKICFQRKISKYFIKILGSPKTKYHHMKYLKDKYNVNKKNTVFFGDSITDFNAAKKYNLAFIQVVNNMKNSKVRLKIRDFHDSKIKKYLNERT